MALRGPQCYSWSDCLGYLGVQVAGRRILCLYLRWGSHLSSQGPTRPKKGNGVRGGGTAFPRRIWKLTVCKSSVFHHILQHVLSHLIVQMLVHTCPLASALLPKSVSSGVQAILALGMSSGPGARLGAWGGGVPGIFQSIGPSKCLGTQAPVLTALGCLWHMDGA